MKSFASQFLFVLLKESVGQEMFHKTRLNVVLVQNVRVTSAQVNVAATEKTKGPARPLSGRILVIEGDRQDLLKKRIKTSASINSRPPGAEQRADLCFHRGPGSPQSVVPAIGSSSGHKLACPSLTRGLIKKA